jgi:hypothetical protein
MQTDIWLEYWDAIDTSHKRAAAPQWGKQYLQVALDGPGFILIQTFYAVHTRKDRLRAYTVAEDDADEPGSDHAQ